MFGMDNPPYDPNEDFDPNDPDARRTANLVRTLIASHPEGITFFEFGQAYKNQITVPEAAIASIRLLLRENQIYSNKPWAGGGFVNDVKLFART